VRYVGAATTPVQCAPIANLPNSAQLEGTPYHFPKLHPGPRRVQECGKGQTHTQADTQTRVTKTPIYTLCVIYDSREM